jgi:hypothetical protein
MPSRTTALNRPAFVVPAEVESGAAARSVLGEVDRTNS